MLDQNDIEEESIGEAHTVVVYKRNATSLLLCGKNVVINTARFHLLHIFMHPSPKCQSLCSTQ